MNPTATFNCRSATEDGVNELSLRDGRWPELFATSRKIGWSVVPSGLVGLSSHDPGVETPDYSRAVPSGLMAGGWVEALGFASGTALAFGEIAVASSRRTFCQSSGVRGVADSRRASSSCCSRLLGGVVSMICFFTVLVD
jgi:hypothetical protein